MHPYERTPPHEGVSTELDIHMNQMVRILIIGALFLTSCASSATPAVPTAAIVPTSTSVAPPTGMPIATAAPTATIIAATETTVATEMPVATEEPTVLPEPTAVVPVLAPVTGQQILKLSAGNGNDQVGIASADQSITGPRAFRIGADGSIRLLDNLNKRVLFFDQTGKLARTIAISEARDPQDFIVNNAGEVFIFDNGNNQVLRYNPKGALASTIPLSPGISASADGIMLNADQDLMLIQNNQSFWVVLHKGTIVPPELQALTMRSGVVTPRSPMAFQVTYAENHNPLLRIVGLRGSQTSDLIGEVDQREIQLPGDVQFFNVDRAMSLYFTRPAPDAAGVDVWRVNPDGTPAGGAQLQTGACETSWRSLYIDQTGAAWTMCSSDSDVTITRYALLAPDGTPLPDAPNSAADVSWRPGARLDAA